jgi:hypothetical protein
MSRPPLRMLRVSANGTILLWATVRSLPFGSVVGWVSVAFGRGLIGSDPPPSGALGRSLILLVIEVFEDLHGSIDRHVFFDLGDFGLGQVLTHEVGTDNEVLRAAVVVAPGNDLVVLLEPWTSCPVRCTPGTGSGRRGSGPRTG